MKLINTTLFSPRNLIVIALIVLAWQIIFSRVHAALDQHDSVAA